jgi:low affinity Fe/Cu permease
MAEGKKDSSLEQRFESIAIRLTKFTGSTPAFIIAVSIILIWGISGPVFNYSETWQLIINTGTTIITFLMVFLIQRTQNKDSLAIQLKLNELIASTKGASNRLVEVEDLPEKDLELLKRYYLKLARLIEKEHDIKESHSIEEAESKHKKKSQSKI